MRLESTTVTPHYDGYIAYVPFYFEGDHKGKSRFLTLLGLYRIFEQEKENLIIDRPNSEYDCTGQAFTTDIQILDKVWDASNEILFVMVKHSVAYDV